MTSDSEWAREQQLQEHCPVVLDHSCDLESERPGTGSSSNSPSIDGEVLWCPSPESGHSIGWAQGQVSQQQQPSHHETAVGIHAAPAAGPSVVAEAANGHGSDETF